MKRLKQMIALLAALSLLWLCACGGKPADGGEGSGGDSSDDPATQQGDSSGETTDPNNPTDAPNPDGSGGTGDADGSGSSDGSGGSGGSGSSNGSGGSSSSGGSGSSGSSGGSGSSGSSSAPSIVPTPGSYSGVIDTYQPRHPGTDTMTDGVSVLDYSNASRGYVMFYTDYNSGARLKLQVAASTTYNYDVSAGQWYTIPLQMGSGGYVIRLLENSSGSSYHAIFNVEKSAISVSLSSSLYPYLYPNIFCSYTNGSSAVRKSFDLCANATTDAEKVAAVYDYVTRHISYDYGKASSVSSGYIPNPDSTLSSGSGICFDYASLVAAMLRAQDIPTQLSVGTRNGADHAWNYIYIDGTGWIAVGISFSGGTWNFTDATFGVAGSGASGGYAELRTY